ncbi:MAG: TadE/TadG family type IV pilus assembly protein [Sphingobium sp.]
MGKSLLEHKGFLARLRDDQTGNTLAIVAAAILPLMGLIGGGIDMSRLYLTKARLQQACDAGALAGRKQMASGAWNASSNKADAVAKQLFDANFKSGSYGTDPSTRSFSESNGKVTGNASAPVPMTIMRIFGAATRPVVVTCDAEMRIPNTDVMFVLDTTGSMGETNPGDSDTKMNGLKKAVKCFYEALMKIDTSADCGSVPTGGNSSGVQLRFGFVPYSVNVNVGKLLDNDWIADRWTYQSRVPQFTTQNVQSGWNTGDVSVFSSQQIATSNFQTSTTIKSGVSSCNGQVPANYIEWRGGEYDRSNESNWQDGQNRVYQWTVRQNGRLHNYTSSYNSWSRQCTITDTYIDGYEQRIYRRTDTPIFSQQPVFREWSYQPQEWDVSALKAGEKSWNSSVTLPVGSNGIDMSVGWDGCIEERETVSTNSYDPIPSGAKDLDIDLIPTTSDATTQWAPMLPGAVWGRYNNGGNNQMGNRSINADLAYNRNYFCPAEAKKLQGWPASSAFESYVNALYPTGNTYHDIGLIWGARLMSPTGLFADENAFTPAGGQIERHLIFMTDGDTVTNQNDYSAYGVAWWDRRTSSNTGQFTNQVNLRFAGLCEEIKRRRITLWVISFGSGVNTASTNRLRTCASQGRFFEAENSQTLIDQFKAIASEISQLRLTN